MNAEQFEQLLGTLCTTLSGECAGGVPFATSSDFERRVREALDEKAAAYGLTVNFSPHPHVFPDIVLGEFGIEVKFTRSDTWRSVANSVAEGTRAPDVKHIYLVFGKMGGQPAVDWGRYEDCVIHVRTSHVPRFEVEIPHRSGAARKSLFAVIGLTYDAFSSLTIHERMEHIRKYARSRLRKGERLWWLEDRSDDEHSLPIQARLYMGLTQAEKRQLRAEAAILCPQVVKPPRSKHKYDDAVLYLLTYHGVLCPQARDLFSAGSVALRSNPVRGGNYLLRALQDIEDEMRAAASKLEEALFVEYWGHSCPPEDRLEQWLRKADRLAQTWKPSHHLFINTRT